MPQNPQTSREVKQSTRREEQASAVGTLVNIPRDPGDGVGGVSALCVCVSESLKVAQWYSRQIHPASVLGETAAGAAYGRLS